MLFYVLHSVHFIEFNWSNLYILKLSCSTHANFLKFNQVSIDYFGFFSHY